MSALLRREVLGLLRARWAFWVLVVTTMATSLLPLIYWPGAGAESLLRGVEAFRVFFIAELIAVLLIVPAATAGSIAGERERGTFELLFSAPLSGRAIVIAKTLAPLLLVLVGLTATMPAAAALYLHGGVEFASLWKCYVVVAMAATVAALGSLTQSARCRSSVQAVTRSLIWSAMWSSGPFIPLGAVALGVLKVYRDIFLIDKARPREPHVVRRVAAAAFDSWTRVVLLGFLSFSAVVLALPITVVLLAGMGPLALGLSPFSAVAFELQSGRESLPSWLIYVLFATVLCLVFWRQLLHTVVRVQVEGEEPRLAVDFAPSPVPSGASPRSPITSTILAWGDRGVRLFSNPVFRQELRTQFHGNAFYRQGLFWGIAIACTLLSLTLRNSQAPFLGAAFIGLLLLPPAGAVGFAREIESGNLDFLRSSALTHGEIFSGKLAAAAVSALCAATAAVCVALVGRLLTCLQQEADSTWPALLGSLLDSLLRGAALSVALTLLVTIASCCSIFCRRSLHAILISYGLAFTLHVGGALIAVYGGLRPADRSDSFPQLGWLALESASPLVLFSSHRNWTPAGLGNDVVDLVLAITLQLCFLLVLCGVARWQLRRVLAGTTSDARC